MSDQLLENLSKDIQYIKENMVTVREYDHLHREFHNTKAEVDILIKEQASTRYLKSIGEKVLWVVLGAVLIAVLKLVGLDA